jgi:prephenate dehydrogenase
VTAGSAAVIGTGLIGASVGLGLRAAGWRVIGWDPDRAALDTAVRLGAITSAASDHDAVLRGADLVVLAGPPAAIVAEVATLDTPALVTDVAGIKVPVITAARLERFVGGHPMAGREVHGADAANVALFRGAAWVLATDGARESDLARMEEIVISLGARPIRMTAVEHDEAVAVTSHLPQVLAAALLGAAADTPGALDLAAGSFRDLTRVAASDPTLWSGLLQINAEHAGPALRRFAARLEQWAAAIDDDGIPAIEEALAAAAATRRSLAPPLVAVRVVLADRPGELAKVGRALAASGVDVRDLQLRHGPHGGGGILTLSVRPGEAEALRVALDDAGLETVS